MRLFVCDLVGFGGNRCAFDALHMTLSYLRSTYASVCRAARSWRASPSKVWCGLVEVLLGQIFTSVHIGILMTLLVYLLEVPPPG